jgi:hypothetical protein
LELFRQNFDGDLPFQSCILSQVDFTHAAPAELLEDFIVRYVLRAHGVPLCWIEAGHILVPGEKGYNRNWGCPQTEFLDRASAIWPACGFPPAPKTGKEPRIPLISQISLILAAPEIRRFV